MELQLNDKVIRKTGRTNTGTIIGINSNTNRVLVKWEGSTPRWNGNDTLTDWIKADSVILATSEVVNKRGITARIKQLQKDIQFCIEQASVSPNKLRSGKKGLTNGQFWASEKVKYERMLAELKEGAARPPVARRGHL